MKLTEPIVICHLPISVKPEIAFRDTARDRSLITAIVEYRKQLEKDNIEVFKRVDNVIATESGYYISFYEKDLNISEEGEEVKPFTGEDGRQKVLLMGKDNTPILKDLAELVANEFCPNPSNYQFVDFIDGDKTNCKAENLIFVKELKS